MNPPRIRIVIAEDQALVRGALAALLGLEPDFEVVGLAADGKDFSENPLPAAHVAQLVELIETSVISSKIAKEVFDHVWNGEGSPAEVVEKHGLKQVTDTGAIEAAIDAIIAKNPDKVTQAKEKPTLLGWFVGQTMKATGGKANPQAVNAVLKAMLGI